MTIPTPARLGETGVIRADLDSFFKEQGLADDRQPEGPIAPGQEGLLEEFLKEQGVGDTHASEGQQLLAGKFKSPEELERGYQELERKLGEQGKTVEPPAPSAPADAGIPDPATYTPEKGQAEYGEQLAAAFTAAEVNPYQLWQDAAAGKDVSAEAKAIAEQLGVAESVVAGYIASNAKPAAPAAPVQPELTQADEKELRALVGGDAEFEKLAEWVRGNAADDLPAYQQAVSTGNKPAVAAWLKAFQARREAGLTVEPQLEGGGNSPGLDRFNSREEVFESMRKTNSRGQRLYDVDAAYQRKHLEKLARSPDFG